MNTKTSLSAGRLCRTLAAAGLSFLLLLTASAQFDGSGIVTGQVSNAATLAFLEGARVTVEGSGQTVITDRQGRYSVRVPSGAANLVIAYTGLDTQQIRVTVPPGGTVVQNISLTSEIYALDEFTVASQREGSALAITLQRTAPNVKNVVSSDSFGNVADGNIGDFLQQLPGITAVYVGADVRSVQIRGIDGALNSVTMDGDRVASSQSAGLGRTFEFEQASLGLIETIEVTKAPTPDMDADSIGGNVNLITKSPFDRAVKRYFNYSVGGVYRPKYMTRQDDWRREPIPHVGPSLNFTYADRLGAEERIGILLTATYHSQPGGDTASVMNYQNTMVDPYWIHSISMPRPAGAPRTRLASGFKVDYKLTDQTTLTLNTAYNWFHENNDTRTLNLATTQNAANFGPGYNSRLVEVLANNNAVATLSGTTDDKSGRTYQFAPSVKHNFAGLTIDYAGSFSNSQTYYEYYPEGRRHKQHPRVHKGLASATLRNVGWIIDRSNSLSWPNVTQTTGPDIYDLNNYSNMLLTQNQRGGEDEIYTLRFNVRKDFDLPVPTFVKAGGNFRQQSRQTWNNARRFNYIGPEGSQANANLGHFLNTSRKWTDSNNGKPQPPWFSLPMITEHVLKHPNEWVEDMVYRNSQNKNGDRRATEQVTAAYVMGGTQISDLSILAGVRVEETETDAEGPLSVGGQFVGRQRSQGEYRSVFPGVHFKYTPLRGLVTRASYSTGIGRPSFGAIIPLDTVNETTEVISRSNPGLRPQYSNNFDVSVEYYFEPVGLVSASVFLKELTNFQFTDRTQVVAPGPDNGYDGQFVGFTIAEPRNGGNARYRGFELSYQQQFTFLPGFWQYLGLTTNFTKLETYGNYGGASATDKLANFVPQTANVGLNYIRSLYSVRLNAVWRDTYLTGINANPALLTWQKPKTQLNLKTKYNFSRRFGLFCDIENLNNSPITETYLGSPDRPATTRIVVMKVVAGIQGQF